MHYNTSTLVSYVIHSIDDNFNLSICYCFGHMSSAVPAAHLAARSRPQLTARCSRERLQFRWTTPQSPQLTQQTQVASTLESQLQKKKLKSLRLKR